MTFSNVRLGSLLLDGPIFTLYGSNDVNMHRDGPSGFRVRTMGNFIWGEDMPVN